ncbi:MAG: hemolysin III family protein [Clostridia bacterium]|nr:hemolysin III family protein [Clostridia bacterium]
MFDLKDIPLAKYSRNEDIANCITHALGIPFCIIAAVMLLRLQVGRAPGRFIFSTVLYVFSMLLVFAGSAIYHGLKPSRVKQIARVIDHCNIFFMIAGMVTAFTLPSITGENKGKSLIIVAAVWALSLLGVLFTFMDFKKFAKPQIFMYIIMGWICVAGLISVFKSGEAGRQFVMLVIIGGVSITVGSVLYFIGKKHKFFHAVFHTFVLIGTIFIFIGLYSYEKYLLT